MKIHLITVGAPKLDYAKRGWAEYLKRLSHYHQMRVTHIPDKHNNTAHLLQVSAGSHLVALTINGPQYSSHQLADYLHRLAIQAVEVSFIIGGPDGLTSEFIDQSDQQLGLSKLTFPHDLAMVILAESLYRASSISAGQPYHR